ncbi:hypothetical protein BH20BAC1_BH20BAC1_02320 [soil metagenome]
MNIRTTLLSPAIFFSLLSMAFLPGNFHPEGAITSQVMTLKSEAANEYRIVVSKKNYELKVYDSEGWYATYPCVFGSSDLRDKFMEGDKRTPEGNFRVL